MPSDQRQFREIYRLREYWFSQFIKSTFITTSDSTEISLTQYIPPVFSIIKLNLIQFNYAWSHLYLSVFTCIRQPLLSVWATFLLIEMTIRSYLSIICHVQSYDSIIFLSIIWPQYLEHIFFVTLGISKISFIFVLKLLYLSSYLKQYFNPFGLEFLTLGSHQLRSNWISTHFLLVTLDSFLWLEGYVYLCFPFPFHFTPVWW